MSQKQFRKNLKSNVVRGVTAKPEQKTREAARALMLQVFVRSMKVFDVTLSVSVGLELVGDIAIDLRVAQYL